MEPRYTYDSKTVQKESDNVRNQMLRSSGWFIAERGILSMAPLNWIDEGGVGWLPYFDFSDSELLLRVQSADGSGVSSTIHLVNTHSGSSRVHLSFGGLVMDILRSGKTPAEAVQSMLMAQFASRYQDYIFGVGDETTEAYGHNPHFDNTTMSMHLFSKRADFIRVQIPGGRGRLAEHAAGATLSYVSIMIVVALHNAVVAIVLTWYLRSTSQSKTWEATLTLN